LTCTSFLGTPVCASWCFLRRLTASPIAKLTSRVKHNSCPSFWASLLNPRIRKSDRRRPRRLRMHVGYTATCAFEWLEARTLLSGEGIPTVPVSAAHWTFDEGMGTIAADVSGNGHTATLGTGVSWTDGNVGTDAISLTGTANGVAPAAGPVVDPSGSFTASAWVEFESLSGYQTVVSIAGNTVAGFYLQLRGDTGAFAFARLSSDANGIATFVSAPTQPVVGTWYHIVGVNDATAGTLTLYVDGQAMGSTAYSGGWEATGDTLIGHGFYNGGGGGYFRGSVAATSLCA